jgi:hypothetical protein
LKEERQVRGGYCGGRRHYELNCGGGTSFIGAMISSIAVCVVEEEGAENGTNTEYCIALVSGRRVYVSISTSRLQLESIQRIGTYSSTITGRRCRGRPKGL